MYIKNVPSLWLLHKIVHKLSAPDFLRDRSIQRTGATVLIAIECVSCPHTAVLGPYSIVAGPTAAAPVAATRLCGRVTADRRAARLVVLSVAIRTRIVVA